MMKTRAPYACVVAVSIVAPPSVNGNPGIGPQ